MAGYPGTDNPARPRLIAPPGRDECFRRVVGAWGNEDLIENAFAIEEYDAELDGRGRRAARPLPGGAALHHHLRGRLHVDERRRQVHLRRRLPPGRGAGRDRPRHRPADRRGDPAASRAHRDPRPHDPRARPASTPGGPARDAVVLTHISDELDAAWARKEGSEAFGGPVEVAREGAVYEV